MTHARFVRSALLTPIRRHCRHILLTATLALVAVASGEAASTLTVGSRAFQPTEVFAKEEDFFGKRVIKLAFLAAPLTDAEKATLTKSGMLQSGFRSIGRSPVFELWLFLQPGAGCRTQDVLSYTAVFTKTLEFPIDVAVTDPINFSINRAQGAPVSEVGIERLECDTKGSLRIKVAHSFRTDRPAWDRILPRGTNRLNFAWNIDVVAVVVGR